MTKNQLRVNGYSKITSLVDMESVKSINYKIMNEINNPSSLMKGIDYKKLSKKKYLTSL